MARQLTDEAGVAKVNTERKRRKRATITDVVSYRTPTRHSAINLAKEQRRPLQYRRLGVTVTMSFTGTATIDAGIDAISLEDGVSRSSVFRQALLRYFDDRGVAWRAE